MNQYESSVYSLPFAPRDEFVNTLDNAFDIEKDLDWSTVWSSIIAIFYHIMVLFGRRIEVYYDGVVIHSHIISVHFTVNLRYPSATDGKLTGKTVYFSLQITNFVGLIQSRLVEPIQSRFMELYESYVSRTLELCFSLLWLMLCLFRRRSRNTIRRDLSLSKWSQGSRLPRSKWRRRTT